MEIGQLDVIVRVAGATLLFLLVALLVRDPRTRRLGGVFAPLALCLSGFLAGNTPESALQLGGAIGRLASLIAGYAAVFLWWFCLASFDRTFRPRGAVLAAGLAWLAIASVDRGLFGSALESRGLSWLLIVIGFGMIAHLAWRLVSDRAGDLVEESRRARVVVVVLLGGQLLVDLLADVIMGLDWTPHAFTIAQNTAFLAFAAWLALRLLPVPPPVAALAPIIVSPTGEEALAERLRILIEVEQAHLEPGLTFADFVRRMGAPERTVRAFINHRLGHDHFRAFLNAHRVAEARRRMADPARPGDKLITIAMDSGFASLASFNRAFLAVEGRPPSAYRAAATGSEERSAAF